MNAAKIISAIVAVPRRPDRFSVIVDGRPFATLGIEALDGLRLTVGSSVAGQEQVIRDEASELHVYDRALKMLAARARSSHDLERQLVRKGEDLRHVRAALERLKRTGVLDDAAFVKQFARSKAFESGLGSPRIRRELARRGVPRSLVSEVVRQLLDDGELRDAEAAERAAQKRIRLLAGLAPVVRRRRLYAFLARRGHDPATIAGVLRKML